MRNLEVCVSISHAKPRYMCVYQSLTYRYTCEIWRCVYLSLMLNPDICVCINHSHTDTHAKCGGVCIYPLSKPDICVCINQSHTDTHAKSGGVCIYLSLSISPHVCVHVCVYIYISNMNRSLASAPTHEVYVCLLKFLGLHNSYSNIGSSLKTISHICLLI